MNVSGYAAFEPKSELKPLKYDLSLQTDNDVIVKVSHCGICHSDVHLIDNNWNTNKYPLVPGHEVIGTVVEKGSGVTHLAVGDRVGIGWQCGSCFECEYCLSGKENYCKRNQATCVGHHGGFADYVHSDSRFAFKIPEVLDSAEAAPLLCAGITVYSPIKAFTHAKTKSVGVIGVGGLGHLALQFAAKSGYEVTAFSTNDSKREECLGFGAKNFVNYKKSYESIVPASCDLIISTVHHDLQWNEFLRALKPEGTLCFVGIPSKPLDISVGSLLSGRKRVSASPIGDRTTIEEMLAFAAKHGVRARIESRSFADVNPAIAHVRADKARYRVVLGR